MTDQELLTEIQHALLEPPDGGATWPSGLWTQAEVLSAANMAQDLLLKRTQLLIGQVTLPVTAGVARVALPDDWLATWQVVWRGSDGTVRELIRSDQFQADHAQPAWPSTLDTPEVYFDHDQALLQIQLAPIPDIDGDLDVFYVPAGVTLDATGENLTVPDELAPSLKFGLLADLLGKDGRGKSPERAAYAQGRFDLGIDVAGVILRSAWVG